VRERLLRAGVRTQVVLLEATCMATHCPIPANRTSRLTPVGATWVGGAEAYAPHCETHHA
jgi:thymidine kinase